MLAQSSVIAMLIAMIFWLTGTSVLVPGAMDAGVAFY